MKDFSTLVAEAADILIELRALESQTKLSASAFLAEAMLTAGCTRNLLDKIDKKLKETSAPAITAFLRKLSREMCEPTFPHPPDDHARIGKVARVYGGTDLLGELAGLGIKLPAIVALAARHATTRSPNSFGSIENIADHHREIDELREKLKSLYQKMQASVSGSDLVFDQSRLSTSERDAGLCHVTFRQYPQLKFGPDWPSRIVLEEIRSRVS